MKKIARERKARGEGPTGGVVTGCYAAALVVSMAMNAIGRQRIHVLAPGW